MNIFPAIDLKENKCVRLSKGEDSTSVVFNENPVDQAKYFEDQGCKRLHLVDLDSAFGRNNINKKTIQNIRNAISIPIQIGGGIRSENIAKSYFELGADFLIIGSYAVSNTQEVKNLAENFKQKIYVALDVLHNKIMIKGWVEESDFTPEKIFQTYDESNIRGYVLTDIEKDGMLTGLNQKMISTNMSLTNKKLIVGGGLKNNLDLEQLRNIKSDNLEGVIAGKSFYVGNIEPRKNILKLAQAYNSLWECSAIDQDVQLLIVGQKGWYYKEILNGIDALPSREQIKLIGPVYGEDLAGFYQLASIMAYPSMFEGFGYPVLESMRLGTPVLTSNISSTVSTCK